ncbi:trehalose-6-phosphate synthase, putative [Ricinus communis]|uniref:Trehalose-6-phosphate synthase, putative n=2 Tax=Ricinus communis TaxID=3988 RepID=B9T4K9_RICCO|nr:trehalose-6-phosphate synthase, putative [Ricinus communis]|eukprot:XP_002533178.3 probable alpha,alpha-trehalose-phosphate synthase [UDP-forming] 11 [Ricinus communis]
MSSLSDGRRVVVSNQLPIISNLNKETNKWCFNLDKDSLVLQLKDGFPVNTEVCYVGTLKADIEVKDQQEVSQLLFDKFKCVPVFLDLDMHNSFYHGFCKHYLWPLLHYMLPISPSHNARFDRSQWKAYVSANIAFAGKVMEVLNPDEDFVWIHDYHLMVLPTLLRKKYHRIKVGFFLHNLFPSSEIYRTIPVREEILRGFLNCDLVGFQTFDYARHFLSCCSRMLGLNYESKRGHLGLDYFGRIVNIKILPVGIHMGQLEYLLNMEKTAKMAKQLKQKYEGKIVMVGVDDLDMFKGISLKFLAIWRLLEQHESLRGKLVLVQITNPARSQGKDVQEVESETKLILRQINQLYGTAEYVPIVYINRPVSTQEKAAYYAISECCVVNAIRDGMNLVSYKYTVCRQGSPFLDRVLEIDKKSNPKKSVLIVSEFIGCSPSLSGAIRVNPWNVDDVADAMFKAIKMSEEEKHLRHKKHYKYISSHDVAYWARSFDQDLERACRDHYSKRYWGVGLGLNFRIVALGPNFRKLAMEPIVKAYNKTSSRLILLDYDGTMKSQCSIDKAPRSDVISVLNCLCSDPKNVLFIVSGRGKDSLSNWFSPCERLGIAAEHGFFTRWTRDTPWESCPIVMDYGWKRIAEPVLKLYTEATDGSFIEHKESALVWHYTETDSHFGISQAKELLDHLENVLANEPVVVKRGQYIVEVKPQGVSKGMVVEKLISTMRSEGKLPDFLLCIGDDRSDEDMFESIESHVDDPSAPPIAEVFACTVGQKPSMAKYYLDDTSEVISLLLGIATSSVAGPKYAPDDV